MIAAVALVKNEADIVRQTVGHMLQEVDRVYVADNGSTDGTTDILYGLDGELVVLEDPEPGYYQSRKMSSLAAIAFEDGAEWIVPFDADEVWLAATGTLSETLAGLGTGVLAASAKVYDHVATAEDVGDNPIERMVWRRHRPLPFPKVAARAAEGLLIHEGNHAASLDGTLLPGLRGRLLVHHYPYRSVEHFHRKALNGRAAMEATDLPEKTCQHWRGYGCLTEQQRDEVFLKWYFRSKPEKQIVVDGEVQSPLVHDPVPVWQPA